MYAAMKLIYKINTIQLIDWICLTDHLNQVFKLQHLESKWRSKMKTIGPISSTSVQLNRYKIFSLIYQSVL